MLRGLLKFSRSSHWAFVISLAVLFWAGQFLPALAGTALCQMKSAAGHHGCQSAAKHNAHGCCCGDADAQQTGLKGQCCEIQQADRNVDQDIAVSLVPNNSTQESIGLVAESRSGPDFDLFTGPTGALDWVKSKSLSKPIYLTNLNFLC